ncbi:MAG: CBS domain-containing protein [Bacteroidetes bacterium]|jgi:CBS domain-containing protein|nr:CBS domain-containing protein [Bacteroidota bacterium]
MKDYPSVTDYMATKLITFSPDMDIRAAMNTLLKKKISGAPVLNAKGELIGILSEVDCMRILIEAPYNQDPTHNKDKVEDYMSTRIKTISADKNIFDAAYEFVHSGYKRLPVVEDKKLVGQISRVDVLRAIQRLEPDIKHIPDSWKGREPAMPDHKKTHYNKNA